MTSAVQKLTDTARNLNILLGILGRKVNDANDGNVAKAKKSKFGLRFVP